MKKNEPKPTITIELPKVLEAYCRWIFESSPNEEAIKLSRRHNVGRHIFSHIKICDTPCKSPIRNNPVTFILPTTDNAYLALTSHFIYVTDFDVMQIRDYIHADFNHWCRARFEAGYFLGWTNTEIIDAILRGLNVRKNAANMDAIKKNDYRNRRKKEIKRFELLLSTDI